jgi:DNA-binding transcriptional regulator YhcF (GntR family)
VIVSGPSLVVDTDSPVPPYEQVRAGLAGRITRGELVTGTRLPTVRGLADELGLAVNTVARAYRELEAGGLVRTEGRAGTFVRPADASRAQVEAAARAYAEVVRATGTGPDDAVALLQAVLGGVG